MKKKMKITSLVLASSLAIVIPAIVVPTVLLNTKNENKQNEIIKNNNLNFNSSKINSLAPILASTADPIFSFYKPSSLTFQTNASNWSTNSYPSQITGTQIKSILDSALNNTNINTPTTNTSGYQLQLQQTVDGKTTFNNVTATELSGITHFVLGNVANPSVFSRITVIINSYNNTLGTVNFSVLEQLQSYQNQDGVINPSQNSAINGFKVQSIILPPSQYASSSNANEWTLPSMFTVKKLSYNFAWNSNEQIGNFINNFPNASVVVNDKDITDNFFTLTPSIIDPNQSFVISPAISLNASPGNGSLQVTISFTPTAINPAEVFFNGNVIPSITRTFYGFRLLTNSGIQPAAQIRLSLLTNSQLLNATITQQYWSTNSTPPGSAGSPNTTVSRMLPSLFVNPISPPTPTNPFLSIFTGASPGLNIVNVSGQTIHYIGNLTYLNQNSGFFSGFPTFQITNVITHPNDQEGTLEVVVYYDQISSTGSIIPATPISYTYTGFQKNLDNGKTLSLSWLSNIPSTFSLMSSTQIIDLYKQLSNQISVETNKLVPSTLPQAKSFVANFFTASSDTTEIYNADASVSLSQSSVNVNQIEFEVIFPSFNGVATTTQNAYVILGVTEVTPVSTITLNQDYLSLISNPLKDTVPSDITDSQIQQMITIQANNGQTNTFATGGITIFAVPNDKTGQLFVTYIFSEFNGISNFGYSQTFVGFKQNLLLTTNLVVPYISNINLPSTFMNLNPDVLPIANSPLPVPQQQVTAQVILNALIIFNSSNTLLRNIITSNNIQITLRTPTSIEFTLSIDWQSIINSNSTSSSLQAVPAIKQSTGTGGTTTNSDQIDMPFVINGFTGHPTTTSNINETPQPVIIPNNTLVYGLGIGLSLSAVLIIFTIVAILIKRKNK